MASRSSFERAGLRGGLRIQILVALTVLLFVAFVPLFFAATRVTRATLENARESEARSTAQALAVRAEAARAANGNLEELLARQAEAIPLVAASIFDEQGRRLAARGEEPRRELPTSATDVIRSTHGSIEVRATSGNTTVILRLWSREAHAAAETVERLFALYLMLFALTILTFAYLALTRLLVRPIDGLVRSTERIASGSSVKDLPREGASEIVRLSDSIAVMAQSLLAKEEAMRMKVLELTETTRQLERKEQELVGSEHMASVGRLAAGVAHEIGNPIAAILGMEELLIEGGLEKAEERDFLERMKRETERVHGVLRDLLDYARAGKRANLADETTVANAYAVAQDVVALARPQKDFKSFELDVKLPEDLSLAISPARLTQVILNLVLNAGAALRDRPDGRIRISARRTATEGILRVEDNGPGIPSAVKDVVFDPFFTTKDVGEGTGLGLSVCRGIVTAHGGTIRIDPSHVSGAAFEIALPLAKKEP